MHELSLMEELMSLVDNAAREQNATSIEAIHLAVGELSGVDPQALSFAFDSVVQGTIARHAKLVISRIAVIAYCPVCSLEFTPPDVVYLCPTCGRFSQEIRQGTELTLASVEMTTHE